MAKLDDALLPVFAAQHWLITSDDIRRAGGSASAATRRVKSGRWAHADRGVFRLAGAPQTWESSVLAPVLSIGGRAMASHLSAAALHGVPGFVRRGRPEVAIPRGQEHRRADVRIRTSSDLDRCDCSVIDAVPTTDLSRTILDLARKVPDQRLLRIIEWARRERQLTWSALISTLARHARKGRPGIQRLRRVIAANVDRDEVTDSDFELMFLALLAERGIPTPILHHRVFDGERFVAEVDLAFPALKIAIELDGAVHLRPEVRERDLSRQNDLVLLGWTVLRFSWRRFVERPELIVAEIRAAVAGAAARIAA